MSQKRRSGLAENWKSIAACSLVGLCPFQYGIDFGTIGGLQAMVGFLKVFGHQDPHTPIGWNIGPVRQQLISSLMTLGACVGALGAGYVAKFMGRKPSLWAACLLCCVSNVIMMTTSSIGGLYAGRLLIGIANGMLMTFSQLYIQECVPARYRGMLLSNFNLGTAFGSLIGAIVDNFTSKRSGRDSYLIPLGIVYIMPVIISIGMLGIAESPRWLAQHGKREQARKSLLWLRPDPELVDEELNAIMAAIEGEQELSKTTGFFDMFKTPVDRRRTILAVGGLSVQAASGSMFIIAYGTYFFEMAHVGSPFENHCIAVAVGAVGLIINSIFATRYGRRRVCLLTGLCLAGLMQLIMAAVYTVHPGTRSTGKAIVGITIIYLACYNGLIAPYAWLSGGELPSSRLRSYTFGLATTMGFFFAWLTTFTAPYFINPDAMNWGPKYGYIWAPCALIAAAWVYFFLPEVKDRTLEEIDEMFEARVPTRQFRKYKCVGKVAMEPSVGDNKAFDMHKEIEPTTEAAAEATTLAKV